MADDSAPDAQGKYASVAGVERLAAELSKSLTTVAGVITALQKRVATLEARLREIEKAPGAVSAADLQKLQRTLAARVVPIYENGRLVGAERDLSPRDRN